MKKKSRNNTKKFPITLLLRVIVVVLLLFLVYGIWIILSKTVSVKAVECRLISQDSCPNELQQAITPLLGRSMFFENYSQTLTTANTITQPVSLVKVKKSFPSTVTLTFQPEPAAYVLQVQDQLIMVSQSGKTFAGNSLEPQLLIIEADQSLITEAGSVPPDVHHTLLTVINTASELQLPLKKIRWVDKSTIQLSMENREELFVLDSTSPRLQLYKLSLVLKSNEYRDISETKKELDLRFNMPVLRTLP